ncbi:small metal-binding protein SmbP [Methylotetracoccus oryzae]|uniref:small metal-binding protein SmbP n=1 Tax=Methylotetracoccus oryzae TaxID=1919059 RepID=UPI001F28DE93|nr:small metal-binding protein SmbP [Methylotetracoccus oryzae]
MEVSMQTRFKRLIPKVIFVFTLGFAVTSGAEDHKAEAMKQAQAALDSGKQGNAAAVAEHAAAAKIHAEAAQQERPNPHLDAAIKNLDAAIAEGRKGNASSAEEAAFGAVTHLKAAEKSF